MILQRLVDYYDRLAGDPNDPMTKSGFSRKKISFELVIEPDGSSALLNDVRDQWGKKLFPRMMVVPDRGGRSGIGLNPNFLWDNTGYVLGRDSKDKPDRARQAFESFRDFHQQMAERIDDPELWAVAKFLVGWSPEKTAEFPLFSEAVDKNIVFRVRGNTHFVHQSPKVAREWKVPIADDEVILNGQSLVSGDIGPIARLHPMISGVTGAQTMGAAIASFNADAYESYHKLQTYNAPVSVADAFKYATALNRLLENRHRRIQLGDATVVFWAEKPTPLEEYADAMFSDMPLPKADAPPEDIARAQQVRLFLNQLRDGHAGREVLAADSDVGFYILGLSPNASRLSVRFWVQTTVGELERKLAQHLQDTALTGARPDDPPLVIRRIVEAAGRAKFKNQAFQGYDTDAIPPLLEGGVARAVFEGLPYPAMLLSQMVNRLRADAHVSHARVSAIKGCLVRQARSIEQRKEISVALDTSRTDPAYVTGRIFATLEKIQGDSLGGDLNSTIRDRYFSAASATPGMVFPRLIRLSQHHLAKLEDRQKVFYERLLQEAIGKLSSFEKHFHLEDQGLFAIGYFHQRQAFFTKKNTESKQEGAEQ